MVNVYLPEYIEFMHELNDYNDKVSKGIEAISVLENSLAIANEHDDKADEILDEAYIRALTLVSDLNFDKVVSLEDDDDKDKRKRNRGFITKILGAIFKAVGRVKVFFQKWMIKTIAQISKLFTDLEARKERLELLKERGYKPQFDRMADETFFKFRTFHLSHMVYLDDIARDDYLTAMEKATEMYLDKGFINKILKDIKSFTNGKEMKSVFNNRGLIQALESSWLEKALNILCKSKRDKDIAIVGVSFGKVQILKRCKPLHLDFKFIPFIYRTTTLPVRSVDYDYITGRTTSIDYKAYDIDKMIKLLDKATPLWKKKNNFMNKVWEVYTYNSPEMDEIDDSVNFENIFFYLSLPTVLSAVAATFHEYITACDSMSKMFIDVARKDKSNDD